MFEPTAISPISLSTEQRDVLREYFSNCLENDRSHRSHPLEFVLVLSGDKPACTMHPSEEEFPHDPFDPAAGLRRLCDQFNVVYRKPRNNWWFVAAVEGRIDMLPSGNRTDRNDAWYRRLGVVLGYPPEAIEAFIAARGQWTDPSEYVATGQFSVEEMANAGFVFYRHDDSVEGYEHAIETGRRIQERLNELADEWNIPELEEFIAEHRNHLRDEVGPEKTTP